MVLIAIYIALQSALEKTPRKNISEPKGNTMARTSSKSKSTEFVPMKHTRAMLSDVWSEWLNVLGHTPDKAKKMMTAAITEMHKSETKGIKKVKSKAKSVKKAVSKKKIVKKTKALKGKVSK